MPVRVGCAMWANRDWIGRSLPADTRPAQLLDAYSRRFGAVEGNTTFYGLPSPGSVRRWAGEAPESFRFLFKLPRTITHERRLRDAGDEVAEFCRRVEPLGSRLGPTSVQLPASFGPGQLGQLDRFLAALPGDRPWSVEVRHPDFFAGGTSEQALDGLLHRHGMDRVVLDSRALFSRPAAGEAERVAQGAKPRLPVRPMATGRFPVVRFIGHLDPDVSAAHWARWLPVVARWVDQGRSPALLFHTADNVDAPDQALRFVDDLLTHAPGLATELVPAAGPEPGPTAATLPLS